MKESTREKAKPCRYPANVLLSLFVTILGSTIRAQEAPNLELRLLCDKETYLVGESIWIDILIISHEDDTTRVFFPCPEAGYVDFTVIKDGTDTLPYYSLHADYIGISGEPDYGLSPRDSVYYCFNLDLVDGYLREATSGELTKILSETDVTISGLYWNYYESNCLQIRITEPRGTEKEAYGLWCEGGKGRPSHLRKYEEILDRYPESVYAPDACCCLLRSYRGYSGPPPRDSVNTHRYAQIMLERYPNSGYTGYAVSSELYGSSDSRRNALLDSLQTSDNPFRLRMIARNLKRGLPTY